MKEAILAIASMINPKAAIESHAIIESGFLSMTVNGVSVSYPVDTMIDFCPNVATIKAAIKNIPDEGVTITIQNVRGKPMMEMMWSTGAISVGGVNRSMLSIAHPDPEAGELDESFSECIAPACAILDQASGDPRATHAFCKDGTVSYNNGRTAGQTFIGSITPENLPIPLKMLKVMKNIKAKICAFGFSRTSVTIYYENGAFVKCEFSRCAAPNTSRLFDDFKNDLRPAKEIVAAIIRTTPFTKKGVENQQITLDSEGVKIIRENRIVYSESVDLGVVKMLNVNLSEFGKIKTFVKNIMICETGLYATDGKSTRLFMSPLEPFSVVAAVSEEAARKIKEEIENAR